MYAVSVLEGVSQEDTAIYFSKDRPEYVAEVVTGTGPLKPDGTHPYPAIFRFVEITPTNGHQKGRKTKIPMERVLGISEDE